MALFPNSDAEDTRNQVKLMTVHTAKGLEFPHVFLCGMNEGIFPSKKTATLPGMEEERRLAFVAMTRAEKALYFSEAEGRNFDSSPRYPSRFLLDIDPALLTYTQQPREGLIAEARDYIALSGHYLEEDSQRELLSLGQRITHIIFGAGIIVDVDPAKAAYTVQFDGMDTPRTISFRAKLDKC